MNGYVAMKNNKSDNVLQYELDDDDKFRITVIFHESVIPKLRKLDARLGTINCDFAGEQYKNWNLHFKSTGSDFAIVDFEYDDESCSFSLDQ